MIFKFFNKNPVYFGVVYSAEPLEAMGYYIYHPVQNTSLPQTASYSMSKVGWTVRASSTEF
jgi:hypothetical protein